MMQMMIDLSFYKEFAKDIAARQGKQVQLKSNTFDASEHTRLIWSSRSKRLVFSYYVMLWCMVLKHQVSVIRLVKTAVGTIDLEVKDSGSDVLC